VVESIQKSTAKHPSSRFGFVALQLEFDLGVVQEEYAMEDHVVDRCGLEGMLGDKTYCFRGEGMHVVKVVSVGIVRLSSHLSSHFSILYSSSAVELNRLQQDKEQAGDKLERGIPGLVKPEQAQA
jgi:hypothetical protein